MLSGIPQGSVLGPLLFIIFINDLPDEIKNNICKLFADDCKLYCEILREGNDNLMQRDLTNLELWSKKWQLLFNIDKCKVMHVGRKNPQLSYSLYGENLKTTIEEKDLGAIIDKDLKFHSHTSCAVKKAN